MLFYGAGVIGSLYALRLQEAGHEVSIVARGRRLADLRRHGIVLEEAGTGHRTAARVGVVQQLDPGDAYDLIVVAVRKNQLPPILPELARNLRTPDVLFMLNNAAGPEEAARMLGRGRLLLGFPGRRVAGRPPRPLPRPARLAAEDNLRRAGRAGHPAAGAGGRRVRGGRVPRGREP